MGYTTEEEFEKFISGENGNDLVTLQTSNTCESHKTFGDDELKEIKKNINKKHKCTYDGCGKSFTRPSRLQWHIRQHTGERPHKCIFQDCDKAYTTLSHLKRHAKTHNTTRYSIKCHICELTLKNRDNFKKHFQRIHNNPNRLSCTDCTQIFRKKSKLEEHMRIHNKTSSIKCDKCEKFFTTTYLLKKHEKSSHSRISKCTEDNCNQEFYRFIDLRVHRKRAHPKEFPCEKCEKRFVTKSALKYHQQVHNLILLSCPYDKCSRVYLYKNNLQHHIKSKHLGVKFYCDICGVGMTEKASLREHIKKIHSEEIKIRKWPKIGSERQKRKDAGIPRKSMVTRLLGLNLPRNEEKIILNRSSTIELSNEVFEPSSNS